LIPATRWFAFSRLQQTCVCGVCDAVSGFSSECSRGIVREPRFCCELSASCESSSARCGCRSQGSCPCACSQGVRHFFSSCGQSERTLAAIMLQGSFNDFG
jgi:hypothetical protein